MSSSTPGCSLNASIASAVHDDGEHGEQDRPLSVQTHPEFWTLIGPFGGWSAAVALQAVLDSSSAGFVPVTLSVHFAGAVSAGSVEVRPALTRRNRGTEFWRCSLAQEGVCAVDSQAVLAARRETRTMVDVLMPAVPPPDGIETTQFPGIPWTMNYDSRFITAPPGADSSSFRSLNWVRLRYDEAMSFAGIVALCDACFPRMLFRSQELFPMSTITMNVQFHLDRKDLPGLTHRFLLIEADGNQARRGFFDQHVRLWSPEGRLLATSDQMFWYKTP